MSPTRSLSFAAALTFGLALSACTELRGSEPAPEPSSGLFLDVHHLAPGEVTAEGVAEAHAKDLAVQAKYGVSYERYWFDEDRGTIYCLVRAPSAAAAEAVHREAHGLVADEIHPVQEGILPAPDTGRRTFLDTHEVEPGVLAADVAEAHLQDLAAEGRHDVSFLDYWVDESGGRIYCLAEADRAEDLVETHREAHGLLPTEVEPVVEGR